MVSQPFTENYTNEAKDLNKKLLSDDAFAIVEAIYALRDEIRRHA